VHAFANNLAARVALAISVSIGVAASVATVIAASHKAKAEGEGEDESHSSKKLFHGDTSLKYLIIDYRKNYTIFRHKCQQSWIYFIQKGEKIVSFASFPLKKTHCCDIL
jgi:hypothetical protein